MKLKDVHDQIESLETYLSRCNDKNQYIELLKLTVLFDISESLNTLADTFTNEERINGMVDMMQRVYSSIDELSSDITDHFEELKEKL